MFHSLLSLSEPVPSHIRWVAVAAQWSSSYLKLSAARQLLKGIRMRVGADMGNFVMDLKGSAATSNRSEPLLDVRIAEHWTPTIAAERLRGPLDGLSFGVDRLRVNGLGKHRTALEAVVTCLNR